MVYILQMLSKKHTPLTVGVFDSIEKAKEKGESLCDDIFWEDYEYLRCELNELLPGYDNNFLDFLRRVSLNNQIKEE